MTMRPAASPPMVTSKKTLCVTFAPDTVAASVAISTDLIGSMIATSPSSVLGVPTFRPPPARGPGVACSRSPAAPRPAGLAGARQLCFKNGYHVICPSRRALYIGAAWRRAARSGRRCAEIRPTERPDSPSESPGPAAARRRVRITVSATHGTPLARLAASRRRRVSGRPEGRGASAR